MNHQHHKEKYCGKENGFSSNVVSHNHFNTNSHHSSVVVPTDSYSHLWVPSKTFPDVQSVMTAIDVTQGRLEGKRLYEKEGCKGLPRHLVNNTGYVIHLKKGTHTLYSDHVSNLKYLRFQGDTASVKGVGYFHKVGKWEDYRMVSGKYDICEGGEAPFNLTIGCKTINVDACTPPNYNSVNCGDRLTFLHRNGCMSHHRIVKGCGKELTLDTPIPLKGKCVVKGEGFFIHPSVVLKLCSRHKKSQKMLIEHRLEYSGLDLHLSGLFFTGACGGHSEISHSVIQGECGSLVHVGKADWYNPNVWLNELTINDGSHGNMMLQSFIGCKAKMTIHSNPNTQAWFGIYVNNRISVELKNTGKVSLFSSDFCNNNLGVRCHTGSAANITKTRFIGCKTGVSAKHHSKVNGMPIYVGYDCVKDQAPEFTNNKKALKTNFTSQIQFDEVKMDANTADLDLDKTIYADLSVFDITTIGDFNSYVLFSKVL